MGYKAMTIFNRPYSYESSIYLRQQHFKFEDVRKQFLAEQKKSQEEIFKLLDILSKG